MTKAQIAGITFDGGDGISPFTITPGGLKGWFDSVPIRRTNIDRPMAAGAFAVPGRLAGRTITISGEVYTDHPIKQRHLQSRLTGLLADDGFDRCVVEDELDTTWATVQRNGETVFETDRWGLYAEYELPLFAPDPRRYGELRTFGQASTVNVHHEGNYKALPEITISGAAAGGYTIAGPQGRTIVVTRPLVAGAPHRFEMSTGRLFVSGQRVIGGVASAALFAIPPGLPEVPISVSAGQLTVDMHDTFV